MTQKAYLGTVMYQMSKSQSAKETKRKTEVERHVVGWDYHYTKENSQGFTKCLPALKFQTVKAAVRLSVTKKQTYRVRAHPGSKTKRQT